MKPAMVLVSLLVLSASSTQASWGSARADGDPKDPRAVHLSLVRDLVLRQGALTEGMRSRVQQLTCLSGPCSAAAPASVLCQTAGTDYASGDPLWKCQADMPSGVRFGTTDVICEGFRRPDDPYITKGSCGLEYTLIGSPAGTQAQDQWGWTNQQQHHHQHRSQASSWSWGTMFNWMLALAIISLLYRFLTSPAVRPNVAFTQATGTQPGGGGGGGGWFGGGGGGFGGGGYGGRMNYGPDCAPPPQQPGFWTGLLGGGALGYMMGNRNRPHYGAGYGAGAGFGAAPRFGGGGGFGAGGATGGGTHTATGYGTTRRR
jgi:hypothetical protein